jgi:hypothetical protein
MVAISNKIQLDAELVVELKTYHKSIRDNTISMAQKAFEIRSQYLNADGRKYDEEFEKWWSTHDLDAVFGKRANFTKWASSGSALERAKLDKYLDRMPTTLTALYEAAQLTRDELTLCLQDKFTRASLTETPKGRAKPSPLIHPEVTAAEIKSWRIKWRNPKPKSTEKRRLPFATLKVHGSLYDFDQKGKHGGAMTPELLKEINDALTSSMMPFDEYVLLETKLDALSEGHRRRQEQAGERANKATTRKKNRRRKNKGYSAIDFISVF